MKIFLLVLTACCFLSCASHHASSHDEQHIQQNLNSMSKEQMHFKLQEQNAVMRAQAKTIQEQNKRLAIVQQENQRLTASVQKLNTTVAQLQQSQAQFLKALHAYKRQQNFDALKIKQLTAENKSLSQQLATKTKCYQQTAQQLAKAKKNHNGDSSNIKLVQQMAAKLELERQDLQKKIKQREQAIQSYQVRYKYLTQEYNRVKDSYTSVSNHLNQAMLKISLLEEELKQNQAILRKVSKTGKVQ